MPPSSSPAPRSPGPHGGPSPPVGRAGRWIAARVDGVRRFAPWVALGFALVTALLILGPVRRLGIDTDTAEMISDRLLWRQTYDGYKEAFPQYVDELVVVIDGETPDLADRARRRLAERLRERPDLFPGVHLPGGGPFFRRHALLYLSEEELASVAESLERYGPWLRRLERDPSLGGFLAILEALLADVRRGREELDPAPLLGAAAEAFAAPLEWRFHQVSWQELMWGRRATEEERRAFLLVQPRLEYGSPIPAEAPVKRIRGLVEELRLVPEHGVRVRLTGSVAMKHEELLAVMRGGGRAGLLALLAVSLILYLGLRSARLMAASVVTLVAGLAATAGFAAVAVGHLNLISVAFAVLFIGLGIDYAIHLCLRYRELRREAGSHAPALAAAAADVGPSVALSALTTAACFYAFVPTEFTGVSELGLISGTGMFIGLVATLVLLPALLTIWSPRTEPASDRGEPRSAPPPEGPPEGGRPAAGGPRGGGPPPGGPSGAAESGPLDRVAAAGRRLGRTLAAAPRRHPRRVLALAGVLGLVGLFLLPGLRFDPNPLNLRDPESESVATYLELLADSAASPLTLAILEPGADSARAAARRVARLDAVREAITLDDFVPGGQEEKRERIAEIAEILGPPPGAEGEGSGADGSRRGVAARGRAGLAGVAGREGPPDAGLAEVRALLGSLAGFRPFASPEAAGAARYLGFQVRAWLARAESRSPGVRARMLEDLEESLVGSLPGRIAALRASLRPGRVEWADLPPELVERWVSPEGLHRVEVLPGENVARTEALRRFVEAVRTVAPDATGAPVVQLEAGNAVVRAFRKALLYAVLATVGLLSLALRRVRDVVFVVLPLLLAGLLTVAVSVALGPPLNFANIVALPLLLGVGVDNGIHMVHRARAAPPAHGDLLRTSTARAVVFSSLTTVAGFGSLALSGHPGTASMGVLLTVGMAAVLVCTLAVLPALLRPGGPGAPGVPGPPAGEGAPVGGPATVPPGGAAVPGGDA